MQLTYRGASYSPSSPSVQPKMQAIGVYRGNRILVGSTAPAQPAAVALCYRGVYYQAAD